VVDDNDVFPQAIEVKEPHDVPLYNCTWALVKLDPCPLIVTAE
jgi:hypothetical protein